MFTHMYLAAGHGRDPRGLAGAVPGRPRGGARPITVIYVYMYIDIYILDCLLYVYIYIYIYI